jgi:hypothetical protein
VLLVCERMNGGSGDRMPDVFPVVSSDRFGVVRVGSVGARFLGSRAFFATIDGRSWVKALPLCGDGGRPILLSLNVSVGNTAKWFGEP